MTSLARHLAALGPLALGMTPATAHDAFHYRLDPAHSAISARVPFFGIASKSAHFPRASGTIEIDPARLDEISLDVTLDARALTAGDDVTLGRLKGEKFFDVAHHPELHFSGHRLTMTGETTAQLQGELTARGITRPVTLEVTFGRPPAEDSALDSIALNASLVINRDDFGMTAYHFIVGRKVTITIAVTMVPG